MSRFQAAQEVTILFRGRTECKGTGVGESIHGKAPYTASCCGEVGDNGGCIIIAGRKRDPDGRASGDLETTSSRGMGEVRRALVERSRDTFRLAPLLKWLEQIISHRQRLGTFFQNSGIAMEIFEFLAPNTIPEPKITTIYS